MLRNGNIPLPRSKIDVRAVSIRSCEPQPEQPLRFGIIDGVAGEAREKFATA
jgi:hypothetical protein